MKETLDKLKKEGAELKTDFDKKVAAAKEEATAASAKELAAAKEQLPLRRGEVSESKKRSREHDKERSLQEKRDEQGVHSSQAKIQVVGLNSI